MIQKRTFLTVVQQGTVALQTAFGKNPKKLEPGLHLQIPLYHQLSKIDLREQSIGVSKIQCFTRDNVPCQLEGNLFFSVKDAFAARFKVDDYKASVQQVGTSAIRAVIGQFQYDEIISDRNKINARLCSVIGQSIDQWGVEGRRFEVQDFRPSTHSATRQLELQLEGERARRKQMLDTESQVNVSEGLKRSAVLQSEGKLLSLKNEIAGRYEARIRDATAEKEAIKLKAEALAVQIKTIAEAMGSGTSGKIAFEKILEMSRIENYGKIASGQNNTTYFMKDSGTDVPIYGKLMADQFSKKIE